MPRTPCPEALGGIHGDPNTNGNCPYCGLRIAPRRKYGNSRGARYGTRSLPRQFLDEELARREPAPDQDPMSYLEPSEDTYYDT
jgi:hypothetical protein